MADILRVHSEKGWKALVYHMLSILENSIYLTNTVTPVSLFNF